MNTDFLLGARGIDAPNYIQQGMQAATLGDLVGRGQLQQYALKSQQRADATQEALNRALPGVIQGGWSPESIQTAIQANPDSAAGLLAELDKRQKSQAELRKTNALAGKDEASAKVELLKPLTNQAYALANDPNLSPDKIKQWSMNVANAGLQGLVQTIPFGDWNNPESARKNLKIAGSAFFEAEKQVSTAETGRKNLVDEARQAQDTASQIERRKAETGIGWAGVQNAKDRLSLERDNAGKPVIQTDQEGNIFTVDPRAGTGRQVVGPDGQPLNKGGKPLTETQGNAAAYGARMAQANAALDEIQKSGTDLTNPMNLLAGSVITNPIAGSAAQQAEQAKRNFMTAALRKESGAAISQSEYDMFNKTYFPMVGDKPDVVAQKAALRAQAIENMRTMSGPTGTRAINTAGSKSGGTTVTTPDGQTFTFPSEGAAFEFKQKAGIK